MAAFYQNVILNANLNKIKNIKGKLNSHVDDNHCDNFNAIHHSAFLSTSQIPIIFGEFLPFKL
jgi:hypothetical protein